MEFDFVCVANEDIDRVLRNVQSNLENKFFNLSQINSADRFKINIQKIEIFEYIPTLFQWYIIVHLNFRTSVALDKPLYNYVSSYMKIFLQEEQSKYQVLDVIDSDGKKKTVSFL
jgi:hypothetical protein